MGYRNNSGLPDPTAFEAMSNIRRIEKKEKEKFFDADNILKIARGDIFIVKNQKAYGHEQNNSRPAVIVSNDLNNKYSSTVEVVYLTTKSKKDLPTHVSIVGRTMSKALCEQITTVDKRRLGDFVRTCTEKEMKEIDKAIAISLGLKKKEDDLK